jgi:hypothetical protein
MYRSRIGVLMKMAPYKAGNDYIAFAFAVSSLGLLLAYNIVNLSSTVSGVIGSALAFCFIMAVLSSEGFWSVVLRSRE